MTAAERWTALAERDDDRRGLAEEHVDGVNQGRDGAAGASNSPAERGKGPHADRAGDGSSTSVEGTTVGTGPSPEAVVRSDEVAALTGASLIDAVEADARALSNATSAFAHEVRRFAQVAEVTGQGRLTLHTRAPAVPVGLFAAGDHVVAAFDVPSVESPEVADLLRIYTHEGRNLRPAPNPFAHHKGLNRWISDLYLSHRGRVHLAGIVEQEGRVYLVFEVHHGDDTAPRRHVLGLDLSRGIEDVPLLRTAFLPDPIRPDFEGLPELDLAEWRPGGLTNAYYYHTRVGPLYVFVDWGTLKVRDRLDLPRGAADLVFPGVADSEQSVNPHRAEALWPELERETEELLVRIEASPGRPMVYVYYSAHPRRFRSLDLSAHPGINLPENLGKITSMFLWAGGRLTFLGGLPGTPAAFIEGPGSPDRIYAFRGDHGHLTLHHFDPDKRRVLHSFFDIIDYTLLADGNLYLLQGPPEGPPEPALEHSLECWLTPFRRSAEGVTPDDQSFLRTFDSAAVEALSDAVRSLEPLLEGRDFRSARAHLDRLLIDHPFVERVEPVRDGIQHLHGSLSRCISVEEELGEIHARRRASAREIEADIDAVFSGFDAHPPAQLADTMRAVSRVRGLLGGLERLAAERFLPQDVVDAYQAQRQRLTDRMCALSGRGADQAAARISEAETRIDGLNARATDLASLPELSDAEARLRQELEALTAAVDGIQLLDLEPARALELAQRATAQVVACDRVESALRSRRRELSRARRLEQFNAYVIQLDMRIATEPRTCVEVDACDGRRDALAAEIEARKGDFADFPELTLQLDARIDAARKRYEARKLELLRERDVVREELDAQLRLRLQALQAAARAVDLAPSALEGFLASHPEALQCQAAIDRLKRLGFRGEAAAYQGRLDQLRRLLVSERQEAQTFAIEGDTLRLGDVRLHRNRLSFQLRELPRPTGVALALTGTGLVLGPERLEGLHAPPGYRGLLGETDEVSRAELLAYRMLVAHSTGVHVAFAQRDSISSTDKKKIHPDPDEEGLAGRPDGGGLQALEALCRAVALAHPEEEYTPGMHDRDAARILQAVLPLWNTLGLLRWPAAVRMPALRAWEALPDTAAALARMRAVRDVARFFGDAAAMRDALRAEVGPLDDAGLDYLAAELEAGGLDDVERAALDPTAVAIALDLAQQGDNSLILKTIDAWGPIRARDLLEPLVDRRLAAEGRSVPGLAPEVARLLIRSVVGRDSKTAGVNSPAITHVTVTGLASPHPRTSGPLTLDVPRWAARLEAFLSRDLPSFQRFRAELDLTRRRLEAELELDSLAPRPLARFVWTRLMRRAYLPLVATALEKQLGSLDRPGQDQMGLLLLVSPPGYGKTELLKKIAALLGYAFVSVSGTALGKATTSLDPAAAPDGNAAAALSRLLVGLELRENVMLDIEDVQACSDAFLNKLLPLCDATRTVEIVREGRSQRIDLQGRRVAIVMTLNPLHATVPQALANRANLINLGDVADKHSDDFALSYLEVAAPANQTLEAVALHQDLETFALAMAEDRPFDSLDASLNGRYARAELTRIRVVLEHCMAVRDVLMAVNRACLSSASVEAAFRVDPAFELQGSYRDMVEICRAIEPDWTDATRRAAIVRHYEGQAGLLGEQGEYNLLALKSLLGQLTEADRERLAHIRETFRLAQQRDRAVYVLMERLAEVSQAVERVPATLASNGESAAQRLDLVATTLRQLQEGLATGLEESAASTQLAADGAAARVESAFEQLTGALAGHGEGLSDRLELALTQAAGALDQGAGARLEAALLQAPTTLADRVAEMLNDALQLAAGIVDTAARAQAEAARGTGEEMVRALDASSRSAAQLVGELEQMRLEIAGLPPSWIAATASGYQQLGAQLDRLLSGLKSSPLPVALPAEPVAIAVEPGVAVRLEEGSSGAALQQGLAALQVELSRVRNALSEELPRLGDVTRLTGNTVRDALSSSSSAGHQALGEMIERLAAVLQQQPLAVALEEREAPAWAKELGETMRALRGDLARIASAAERPPQKNDLVGALKALVKALPEDEPSR